MHENERDKGVSEMTRSDLEAAYIEAVEVLRKIADGMPGIRAPHRFTSAQDEARKFLGDA